MSATLELTHDLIARASVTPADEGCQELMASRLSHDRISGRAPALWERRQPVGAARRGAPLLCFAGHTDVVPTGPLEEWRSDPFKPAIRDGLLYGRGAADMKSGLAAMLTATESFVAERSRSSRCHRVSDHQ